MTGVRRAVSSASDEWLAEQQRRAEMEAEAWRLLREARALPPPEAPPAPSPAAFDPHRTGSLILKALVRFGLAACAAYLAWLAGVDSQLGEFEIWLAAGAAFIVTLSLSLLDPFRRLVHMLAETTRWALIAGVAIVGLWLLLNPGWA